MSRTIFCLCLGQLLLWAPVVSLGAAPTKALSRKIGKVSLGMSKHAIETDDIELTRGYSTDNYRKVLLRYTPASNKVVDIYAEYYGTDRQLALKDLIAVEVKKTGRAASPVLNTPVCADEYISCNSAKLVGCAFLEDKETKIVIREVSCTSYPDGSVYSFFSKTIRDKLLFSKLAAESRQANAEYSREVESSKRQRLKDLEKGD